MNTLLRSILTTILSLLIAFMSTHIYAQCKVDNTDKIKGEFSINGSKVQVKGDGSGLVTAENNIPIKICEGELIKLKSTLTVSSLSNVVYWITNASLYNALTKPPSNPLSSDGGYSNINGEVSLKMIDKSSDKSGIISYSGPGRYVITQYDNSDATSGGSGFHHACQVIEIVKPTIPDVQYDKCSGSKVVFNFPATANNIYGNYNIKYLLSNIYKPEERTGKITSYPFSFQNVTDLSGFSSISVEIKGESATGGCDASVRTIPSFTLNNTAINRPSFNAIIGTTLKGEFKLAVSADNGMKRNVYVRDPAISNSFNYTAPFKNYTSNAALGLDSNAVQVTDGNKMYCFQVEAVDSSCPIPFVTNPDLRSDELCTTLIDAIAQNNKNVITWSKAVVGGLIGANFVNYLIERFRPDGTFDKVLYSTVNSADVSFTDASVICGQEYVYKVTTRYPLRSISQSVKVKAISNDIPSKIPRLFTTIDIGNNKSIHMQGQFNSGNVPSNIQPNNYKFYRSNSSNGTYFLQYTGNQVFKDINVDVNKQSYCYYMTWTNLCGAESEPSEKVCTVNLKNNNGILEWTKEKSHSVPTEDYIVQQIDENGFNIKSLEVTSASSPTFDLQKIFLDYGKEMFIQIEARPQGWNIINANVLPSTLSNVVRIFKAPLANEQEENISLRIFPIPTQDSFSVELKTAKPTLLSWSLTNIVGQTIQQESIEKPINNYQTQIDIKSLQKGTYFLRMYSDEKSIVRKIVKE
jgi:hypothetical protein